MADTQDFKNSALRVSKWEKGAMASIFLDSSFGRLFKRKAVYIPEETKGKNAGDTVTIGYCENGTVPGVGEGGVLEGNEEVLNYQSFSFLMNEHRKAWKIAGEYNIQRFRTKADFDMDAFRNLSKYFNGCFDASCFQQAAGAFPTTITVDDIVFSGNDRYLVTGNNTVDAIHADRIIRAGGVANDESLTTTDTMRLDYLDMLIEKARSNPAIEPFSDGTYDLYISPAQWTDLKFDTSGKIQLAEIMYSQVQGGETDVFGSGIGIKSAKVISKYNDINIIISDRIANGVNSSTGASISNVKRAVFVGKKALSFGSPNVEPGAFENMTVENTKPITIKQMTQDYEQYIGIAGISVYGIKRTKFSNTRDTGVIVISTYAAPHTL